MPLTYLDRTADAVAVKVAGDQLITWRFVITDQRREAEAAFAIVIANAVGLRPVAPVCFDDVDVAVAVEIARRHGRCIIIRQRQHK